jgi:hypothetical protein
VKLAAYAFVLFGANLALAQYSTPAEGEYVLNYRGWGALQIQPHGKFKIETIGSNAHTCELDGVIVNGKSKLENSTCEVSFKVDGQDVEVATNEAAACSNFCGARAWFNGLYKRPPPPCTSKSIASSRRKFKREYVAKNYAAALVAINPIATQCNQFLHWIDSAWVLNDLALTQFKLGDRAACIKTLQGLAPDAAKSDDEIKGSYPPSDSEAYLPAVQATRTNLRLCTKK